MDLFRDHGRLLNAHKAIDGLLEGIFEVNTSMICMLRLSLYPGAD